MSTQNKALMTHYADGAIMCRALEQTYNNFADAARFDRDMPEDPQLYRERKLNTPYGGD